MRKLTKTPKNKNVVILVFQVKSSSFNYFLKINGGKFYAKNNE